MTARRPTEAAMTGKRDCVADILRELDLVRAEALGATEAAEAEAERGQARGLLARLRAAWRRE
jgi:hypothetical protein